MTMSIDHFLSERLKEGPPQAEAALFQDFLFVGTQLGWAADRGIPHAGDFPAQFDRAFENLAAVLARAGGSLGDVVRMRYHFFDGRNYIDARRARHRVWPEHGPPATVVIGYGLPDPPALGGLEAIAYLGEDREVIDFSEDFAHRGNTPDYSPEIRGKVGYSPAMRAGRLAFFAGNVSLDSGDNYVHLGDPEGQTRLAHERNLGVLGQLGVDRDAVIRLFQFATYPHYLESVYEITAEYFPHRPPSSSIVAALGWPGTIIESEIVAAIEGASPHYYGGKAYVADPGASAAVRLDNLLFTSSIVGRTSDRRLVGPGDGRAQLDQIFTNLVDLLSEAGTNPSNVLMLNVFLSATTLLPIWEEAKTAFWNEHFAPNQPFPPYTAIAVAALPSFEHLAQIEAIAAVT